jgi:hypothetical protein
MNPFPSTRSLLSAAALLLPWAAIAAQVDPQQSSERLEQLRRDQDEILRKAERLQVLMDRLRQRYEREQRADQVQLLQQGLTHLQQAGVLREIAGVRDDLAATAFTEALRKQRAVVDDLERLLNILLERKSVENIDQEMAAAEAQARTARELEQQQQQLIAAREATRSEPTPAERELMASLAELRDAERAEAERNARAAGSRRPFLESALERVRALLQQQQRLDAAMTAERDGRAAAERAREFDLGELTQATRQLQKALRDQERQQQLGDAGRDLQKEAAGSDTAARQRARDGLEGRLQEPPPRRSGAAGDQRDPDWQRLREQLAKLSADAASQQQLGELGAAAAELSDERNAAAKAATSAASGRLATRAEELAAELAKQPAATGADPAATTPTTPSASSQASPPAATSAAERAPSGKVSAAAKALAAAKAAAEQGDRAAAEAKVNTALQALDEARAELRRQNPDAAQQAGEMAAEAAAVAQELRSSPAPEAAEQQASDATAAASKALREAERALANDDGGNAAGAPAAGSPNTAAPNAATPAGDAKAATASAKQQLQAAEQALAAALAEANAGGDGDRQAAAERQQQLAQQAAATAEQLARAAASPAGDAAGQGAAGQLSQAQQEAAQQALARAQQQMQQAAQQLQQGQQASAASSQQAAAQSLQEAMTAIDDKREPSAAAKAQLQQQAKAQGELAEDIVRLAEELKKRDNQAAERAAQQAADAARKAQRALDAGDEDEAERQQEEARQQLAQAAEELEEEKDRYQDMRQEELLFRMREELTTFLTAQRLINQQTLELQKSALPDGTARAEGLSRAARRKANQLGEEEQQLGNKLDPLLTALGDEDNLVYRKVLQANREDLKEIARRLAGRTPDLGAFTTLMQADLERRTLDLLAALEREKQRREQEQQEQQRQQGGKNRFGPQQRKLVSLIAELEMLKKLGENTGQATEDLRRLVDARDGALTEAEAALIERLSHRHDEITKLFQQIKAGVEQMLQPAEEDTEGGGSGR